MAEVRALRERQARIRGLRYASAVQKSGAVHQPGAVSQVHVGKLKQPSTHPHTSSRPPPMLHTFPVSHTCLNACLRCVALSSAATSSRLDPVYVRAKYNAPVRYRRDRAGCAGSEEEEAEDGGREAEEGAAAIAGAGAEGASTSLRSLAAPETRSGS